VSAITADTYVTTLVLEEPARARVFERFGIDYCCGGGVPLADACAELGLDAAEVVAALSDPGPATAEDVDWAAATIAELVDHIVDHHHAYLRQELPPLTALVEKVARAHGDAHPELHDVQSTFADVAAELTGHMAKEERVLFPACLALADGDRDGRAVSVAGPIQALLHEHEEVGAGLSRLRELTAGYAPPIDACNSYRAMLDRIETLERDTHRHVHEENNVLFPRALALQTSG
jgi:regulator of cell morphogenesis and NO signaling